MTRLFEKYLWCVPFLALALTGAGCATTNLYDETATAANGEPGYITVQHCLIAFAGTGASDTARTKEEAEQLALELFQKAKVGDDFGRIVKMYTDDSPPGIYQMANNGFEGDMSPMIPSEKIFMRGEMVAAFGDTGFPLEVGEYGLAEYNPISSPYGWHIVKRIR